MALTIMFVLMFAFFLIGVPIGVCLLLPIFVLIAMNGITTPAFIASIMYTGVATYTMIALPFFILAGSLMNAGGLSKRLVAIADSLIGRVTGNLGMVAILACMFFGAVSGSAPATVAAIGGIMLPEMVRAGYNKYYAVALITVAGSLGVIVPPSFPMVVYGVAMNVSIGDLFVAGIGPAILVGVLLMAVNYVYCKKHHIVGTKKFSARAVAHSLKDGWPALLMPVIILGGIYGGIFTVTEASVVACVYGVVIGMLYYRELKIPALFKELMSTSTFVGGMLLTLAPASALGQIFAYMGVTRAITKFFTSNFDSKIVVMLLVFLILFIAGMFVQTTPMIVILGPILLNVLEPYGIDAIQFGIIMVLALSIAFCTPPVATNLFVTSSMTGIPLDKIVKPMVPFLIALFAAFFAVAFIPGIIYLPMHLLGG
ncbi:MAG: TRAP transporter large permease [Lachnospiraceae bacterium]|nr:TRAP transporter large permease [Lachnospiraceae bacterium]